MYDKKCVAGRHHCQSPFNSPISAMNLLSKAKVTNLREVSNRAGTPLILVGGQQNKRAGPNGINPCGLRPCFQFRIFGAGIKDETLRFGMDDVIVIQGLRLRADIEGNAVNVRQRISGRLNSNTCNLAFFYSDVDNFMSRINQAVSREVRVPGRVGSCPDDECFLFVHDVKHDIQRYGFPLFIARKFTLCRIGCLPDDGHIENFIQLIQVKQAGIDQVRQQNNGDVFF